MTSKSDNVQKSTLREAAQQALEAMISFESGTGGLYEGEFSAEIAALRAALAEPVQERNFCPRCGKRTNDIHTCTPPGGNDVHS